jgi:hypothetical protein
LLDEFISSVTKIAAATRTQDLRETSASEVDHGASKVPLPFRA